MSHPHRHTAALLVLGRAHQAGVRAGSPLLVVPLEHGCQVGEHRHVPRAPPGADQLPTWCWGAKEGLGLLVLWGRSPGPLHAGGGQVAAGLSSTIPQIKPAPGKSRPPCPPLFCHHVGKWGGPPHPLTGAVAWGPGHLCSPQTRHMADIQGAVRGWVWWGLGSDSGSSGAPERWHMGTDAEG